MANFFDTFDGPEGQALENRPGWRFVLGNGSFLRTTGNGSIKTTNTLQDNNASVGVDTAATSHYVEVELGDLKINAGGTSPVLCAVKSSLQHVYTRTSIEVKYEGTGYRMRQNSYPLGGFWTAPLVAGDVLRLEAKMASDGLSVEAKLFVNGILRIGPVSATASQLLTSDATFVSLGHLSGFAGGTEMLRSFRAGALVQDTTQPTLAGAITVTAKTHNTITAQCPVGNDNVAVTAYEWSRDGGSTWETGTRDFTFTGLTASTSYPLRARAKDAMGLVSDPALALSVTTNQPPPADTTPPAISAPVVTVVNASRALGSITTNEAGTAYAALTHTSTKPTAANVRSGNGALVTANAPVVAGANNGALSLNALQPETDYYMHVTVQDEAGNLSAVATSAKFTTPEGLPEGWLVDDFDGTDGQGLVARGWLASNANTSFASVNGNGGLRSTNSDLSGNPAIYYTDTQSTSHFVETVVGDVTEEAGNGNSFCAVKIALSGGSPSDGCTVTYSDSYKAVYLRESSTGSVISSASHSLVRGDVVRLEAKMALDNLSYDLFVYINGRLRIGPTNRTKGLLNKGAGFRVITYAPSEETLLKVTAGPLTLPPPDVTAPVLSAPGVTVVGPTSATGSIVTDELAICWAGVTTSATKPTALQLKEGVGFVAQHSGAADIGANPEHFLFDDLQPSTTYYMHVAGEDISANVSNVVTSAPFTTPHLGVRGSDILAQTEAGPSGAGFLRDKVGADDGTKYFHYVITRQPVGGSLDAHPNGSFSYLGAASNFQYLLYKNGVEQGVYTVTLGSGAPAADTTPPTLTGALELVAKTETSLSFRCPVGNDNVGVATYQWSRNNGSTWTDGERDFTFAGLAASTPYQVLARAKDGAGNVSTPALSLTESTSAPPVAAVMHCRLPLVANGRTTAAGLSNIAWAWWNTPQPEIGSAADIKGTNASVDSEGTLNIALPGTPLQTGGVGFLQIVINDGVPNGANNRAMAKPVAVGP